jgi:ribosomal protein S18 acetylase RimI-like enzyme
MVISVVDTIEIRAPRDGEQEQVFQVYQTGLPNVDPISHEKFTNWWQRSKENGTLDSLWRVALVDKELVGVVINLISESLGWGLIWELAVSPKWRDKGVGAALVKESQHLLLKKNPKLSHFALGVKTHNQRALPFYERLGFGMRSLVVCCRGPSCFADAGIFSLEPAKANHIRHLAKMRPDSYWSSRDTDNWQRVIQSPEVFIVRKGKENSPIGFLRFEIDEEYEDTTGVNFAYKDGHGVEVIKSASHHANTSYVTFWVQTDHQDILEHLLSNSFHTVDSEYLLLKSVSAQKLL